MLRELIMTVVSKHNHGANLEDRSVPSIATGTERIVARAQSEDRAGDALRSRQPMTTFWSVLWRADQK